MTAVLAAVGVATLVSGFIVIGTTGTAQAKDPVVGDIRHEPVAICHNAGQSGSYVYVAPDNTGVFSGHVGATHQNGLDVIPPFSYEEYDGTSWVRKYFPGQNTDAVVFIGPKKDGGCTPAGEPPGPARVVANATVAPSTTCEVVGSYTIPSTEGVVYKVDGVAKAAGTYQSPLTGTITAVAANEEYVLTNAPYSVTFDISAEACRQVVDIDPKVELVDPCETSGDGIQVVLDGKVMSPDNDKFGYKVTGSRAAGFVVTFSEVAPYNITGELQRSVPPGSWTNNGPCSSPTPVKPVAPTVVQSPACEVEGTYTIPSTPGVKYLLDGVEITAGTYQGPESGTVTAVALSGYQLTEPLAYTLDLPAAVECEDDETPPPPVKDVCTNLNGVQPDVPKGYTEQDGICTEIEVLPTEALDVCSNIKGAQAAVPAGLEAEDGRCVRPAEEKADEVVGPDEVLGTAESVPTAVDAGLGGPTVTTTSTSSPLGQGLVGAGLVMLLLAGAMQMGRARGAHQA